MLRFLAGLSLAAIVGCSTLPRVPSDSGAHHSSRAVQLDGAHGPLSPQRSKAVLARLASRGEETGIFERHLALEEEIAGTPLVVGNKVTLLVDGPATYAAMFEAIAGARDHIHLETYILDDDEAGARFADALLAKRAEGLRVTVIYDSFGAGATPREFFKRLTDAGIEVLEFNPVNPLELKKGWEINRRDHRKLLIVDGRIAFVGGVNISSVYGSGASKQAPGTASKAGPPWRDTHLRMEGPVVAEFQKLFVATWEKQKGAPLAPRNLFPQAKSPGKEVVRALASSPDEPVNPLYVTLLSAIANAETGVYLTNAYFVPDPQLLAALTDAARRGVDVRLVLPGKTDSWLVFHAGRAYFDDLLRAGVKIYARRDALLHAKTAVIDGVWSTVGSSNLDWRSLLHNQEVLGVVLGQEFGAQMQAMFAADVASSEPITLESWRRRPLGDRVSETLAGIWSYWL